MGPGKALFDAVMLDEGMAQSAPSTVAPVTTMLHKGEVLQVLTDWKGRTISPTLPVVVAFGKFRAHFRPDELQAV